MRKKLVFITWLISILFGEITLLAQDSTNKVAWINKHPIEFSVGSHAIGLPFSNFLAPPYYLEMNIGLQSNLLDKKKINLNIVNGIGFAAHPFSGKRYFVDTYLRFKYRFPLNIYSQIGLGIAFNLLTYPDDVYTLNSDGFYEKKNRLEGKLYSGINLEIGYHLKSIKRLKLDLFLKYNVGVNLSYHPQIPVFPYNSIQFGTRFYFQKTKKK